VYKRNMRCVYCNPPEVWGEYLRARVRKILRNVLPERSTVEGNPLCLEIERLLSSVEDTVILVEQNCQWCRCPILIQGVYLSGNSSLFWVACQPDPAWSSHITDHIQSILANEPDRAREPVK